MVSGEFFRAMTSFPKNSRVIKSTACICLLSTELIKTLLDSPSIRKINHHSILKCNYANEAKLEGATRPGPFALFSRKFTQGFSVCRRCASWKGLFDFGVRLGERGDFPIFLGKLHQFCTYEFSVQG